MSNRTIIGQSRGFLQSSIQVPLNGDPGTAESVSGPDLGPGGDNQTGFQPLLNNDVFLNGNISDINSYLSSGITKIRSGSVADMVASVGVIPYDVFFVLGQGLYFYNQASNTFRAPFLYFAEAMGVGVWAWAGYTITLKDVTTNPKIADALLPYSQIVRHAIVNNTSQVGFPVSGFSNWLSVQDSLHNDLSVGIPAFSANDTLEGIAGPFNVISTPASLTVNSSVAIRIRISQLGADIFYGESEVLCIIIGSSYYSNRQLISLPFKVTIPNDGPVAIVIECKGGNGPNPAAIINPSVSQIYGSSAATSQFQWLSWKQLRNF